MDGKKCYCVVKIDADDNEDVAVISSTWLNAARTTAAIPRLPGSSYYRHARNHLQPKSDDPKLPVSILVTTIDFEHAREMEIRYTCGNLPSSDDTINMGLPQKRRIKPPRFADDDSDGDYNAKKRNVGPTAVTYSVPSCSTKHRIPDSDATHGAHTIVQNDNSKKTIPRFLILAGSYFGEAVTKTDFQHLSSSFHTAINGEKMYVAPNALP
ncbi:hypothetical protein AHF37_06284 [Paragonimus kellicotti]|nr:hypothetical protein AHF37_06284 [Paragonimus kellicotti]